MSASTNQLVATSKRLATPVAIAAAFALGAVLYAGHGSVRAASDRPSTLDDHSVAALTSLDQAMESIAARVTPAVVNIAVTSQSSPERGATEQQSEGLPPGFSQFFGQREGRPQIQHGIGSGIIISPDGYILTNNHVVDDARQIRVTLHDRRILSAKLVGVDPLTDLAVVKVNATNLPSISWGDSSKLLPGQTVLAFGSPFGYFQFSVTRGIVSAVNRPNPYSDDARKPGGFIQTDAAINPGNSGGPLVDAHGELVGINTFIISDSGSFAGAGFAIPAQIARAAADQLIKHGKVDHGYLGISMNDVTPDNAHFFHLQEASGAVISQVTPDSPAAKAGLHTGDVIAEINGQKIVNGSALQVAVSELSPGTNITLAILRDGSPTTVRLTLGQFHADSELAKTNQDSPKGGKIGIAVADLTPDVRQHYEIPEQLHGVVVQDVRPASPAEEAGLQPGDIIMEVDRQATTSASQFIDKVHQNLAGKDLLLLVWSRGGSSYRTVHPEQDKQNG